jgi:hypothetical protein
MKLTLILLVAFTLFNTGLIWTIQLVHYPGFLRVGESFYPGYQQFHMRAITMLVGPTMLAELVISALGMRAIWGQTTLYWISLILLGFIWIHTVFIATPIHNQLTSAFQADLIRKLVNMNWLRTVAWTLRAGVILWILYKVIGK